MSGGGGAPAQPSTTTQIQDIPAWEQGYVTDLLGKAQAIAAQPYQQFPGQQVAGFTPDQMRAFSNIQSATGSNLANQNQALGQASQGANTTNGIYDAGAGNINAATSYNPLDAVTPYLSSASGYNSATAAEPWLNQASGYQQQAASAASPQGIQDYMSPYTSSVVQGIQDQANQNWNQNIMPGINDKFIGSGQYASGRNAQVLGQAAGNFQTGLSANIANALQSGYNTAGNQAATQAGILGNLGNSAITGANTASSAQGAQVSNLLNQANAAGTSTQQQAENLLSSGRSLGDLASTQGTQQLNAANTIGNLGAQAANTNLTQNQALQAVGQQQQQLNQTNLNTAMQNWQDQVNYPKEQTEYLNQIIRGLPAPTATTSSTQTTPAYSVSPLSALGGAGAGALSLLGSNGQTIGTAVKRGGLIKGYAEGGMVDDEYGQEMAPLDYASHDDGMNEAQSFMGRPEAIQNPLDTPDNQHDSVNPDAPDGITESQLQQNQLLALAKGMLTPSLGGSTAAALGEGMGEVLKLRMDQQKADAIMASKIADRRNRFEDKYKELVMAQPFKLQTAAANATRINMGAQEKEEDKAVGRAFGEDYVSLQKSGRESPGKIAKYERLNDLLSGIETGAFKATTTDLKSAAKGVGIDLESMGIKDDVAPVQAANALTNAMALELRNPSGGAGMPGAMSDADREYLRSMTPGVEKTKEGRKLMTETAVKLAKRDAEIAQLARNYRSKKGKLDEGFYDALAQYSEQNPLFSKGNMQSPVVPSSRPPLSSFMK